jgi:hypothetical protein
MKCHEKLFKVGFLLILECFSTGLFSWDNSNGNIRESTEVKIAIHFKTVLKSAYAFSRTDVNLRGESPRIRASVDGTVTTILYLVPLVVSA